MIMNNNNFSIQRIALLVRRQTLMSGNTLIVAAGVAAFLLIVLLLTGYNSPVALNDTVFYGITLPIVILGGFIFSSLVFSELQSREKAIFFLSLPATSLEKLAAGWLISSPIFVIFIYVLLMVVNLFTGTLLSLFPGKEFIFVDPFYPPLLNSLGSYMVLQTVFLLGAVYFKKNNFFKTILSVFLVAMVISIWGIIMAYLVLGKTHIGMENVNFPEYWHHFAENILPSIAKTVFWGIIGPFFLFVSWLRLKEREV